MTRHLTTTERRARLGRRHHLAPPHLAGDAKEAAGSLVGLHSSDPATVYLSAWARVPGFSSADLETILYEDRALVRVLGMRRTIFVVPTELAPLLHFGCAYPMYEAERKRLATMLEGAAITDDGPRWIAEVAEKTYAALGKRDQAPATELRKTVPELALQIPYGEDRKWGGTVGVSTRILFLLATEGRILRTRPLGSWLSGQYRWATVESWLGNGHQPLDLGQARMELIGLWLRSYGPGTETDIKWWTGFPVTQVRHALYQLGAVEVALDDDAIGYVLPDDLEADTEVEPWAAFLPGLDPTTMGWKQRHWYLGDHSGPLFDSNGNAGLTVWWEGRVVGGWAQTAAGAVAYRLLEDVGSDARTEIDRRAAEVEAWLGATIVTPRFRNPLERELSGGG